MRLSSHLLSMFQWEKMIMTCLLLLVGWLIAGTSVFALQKGVSGRTRKAELLSAMDKPDVGKRWRRQVSLLWMKKVAELTCLRICEEEIKLHLNTLYSPALKRNKKEDLKSFIPNSLLTPQRCLKISLEWSCSLSIPDTFLLILSESHPFWNVHVLHYSQVWLLLPSLYSVRHYWCRVCLNVSSNELWRPWGQDGTLFIFVLGPFTSTAPGINA